MPQMSPMFWLFLYFYFVGLFIVYLVLLYYFTTISVPSYGARNVVQKSSFNWSW